MSRDGNYLIHQAAKFNKVEVNLISTLLSPFALCLHSTSVQFSYLLQVVELLLDLGCLVDISTRNGMTALHAATSEGHFEVSELLLSRGADANITKGGRNAFHMACSSAKFELMKMVSFLVFICSSYFLQAGKTCETGSSVTIGHW